MKNYERYQVEDFFQDLYFRQWVQGTLPASDEFWKDWIRDNPEKHEIIEQARALIVAFRVEDSPANQDEVGTSIQAILAATYSSASIAFYKRGGFRVAATLLILLGVAVWLGTGLFDSKMEYKTASPDSGLAGPQKASPNPAQSESQIQHITLHDGSKVTLKANSTLRVAENFGKSTREVYLTGEALFDVTKNPRKPFLVYTENLVTRVLGTSFEIRDYHQEDDVSVSVRTGKVTVYKNKQVAQKALSENIILTPNQQAIYVKADHQLIKTLVEKPIKLHEPTQFRNFTYTEAPIPQVLAELEVAYGVKIIFDEEQLKHCNLTARLTNEPLFEKLTLICETIQASYEVIDGQIVLTSQGCP
jgi:transmembrane sensor